MDITYFDRKIETARREDLARHQTASNMASVSLPVKVFCWLGWKDASSVRSGRTITSDPWEKSGRWGGRGSPRSRRMRRSCWKANPPSATSTRTRDSAEISSSRNLLHRSRSDVEGLFPGGAHRTAAVT